MSNSSCDYRIIWNWNSHHEPQHYFSARRRREEKSQEEPCESNGVWKRTINFEGQKCITRANRTVDCRGWLSTIDLPQGQFHFLLAFQKHKTHTTQSKASQFDEKFIKSSWSWPSELLCAHDVDVRSWMWMCLRRCCVIPIEYRKNNRKTDSNNDTSTLSGNRKKSPHSHVPFGELLIEIGIAKMREAWRTCERFRMSFIRKGFPMVFRHCLLGGRGKFAGWWKLFDRSDHQHNSPEIDSMSCRVQLDSSTSLPPFPSSWFMNSVMKSSFNASKEFPRIKMP
jgi:hypothetical protein